MSFAAGAISANNVGSFSVGLHSDPAGGGTGPYTYQWYRDTSPSFTPSGSNDLPGFVNLDEIDDTVLPGIEYYYKVVATDTGHSNDTDESNELDVTTQIGGQSQNAFSPSPNQGMLDLSFNTDTITVQIDKDEDPLYASQAVAFTQEAGSPPRVEAISADTDTVNGMLNYNIKDKTFKPEYQAEMSLGGNVMYLVSTEAIARGAPVMVVTDAPGLIATATSGKQVIGYALDVASASGQLIRVKLQLPSIELPS